ncbi:MAG TPA: hypothetical protein VGI76_11130, partial [Solirubrobacteraceae bacterium]|jgi:hypothetical protein
MLLALATLLAAGSVAVGWRTRGFALFGASLFISVLLFGTGITLFRTWDHPKLQPVAVLRSGSDSGMIGYYIAETAASVYIARLDVESAESRPLVEALPHIVVVPRSSVAAIAVGALMEHRAGLRNASQLLHELCTDKVAEPVARESGSVKGASESHATSPNPCPPS